MTKRSAKKSKKKTAPRPRVVPKGFGYPADIVDLRKARLDRLCEWPEPAKVTPQRTVNYVVNRIALIRVMEDCMRVDDPRKLDRPKASAVWKLFRNRWPGVANPLEEQPECRAACRRVHRAKENKERILIYGDYDCDGVTSVTLVYDALRALGFRAAQIDCVIPHRLKDGYNLQAAVVADGQKRLKRSKWRPNLIIAVDCGSTAKREVEKLVGKEGGMDVIVIDHHQPDEDNRLPEMPCVFHLNPKLWMDQPGWKREHRIQNMCASGLAYLFARSLLSGTPGRHRWNASRALLLAGLATCVDVMELNGINRALLKRSLLLANRPGRLDLVPGLAALKQRVGPYPKTGLFVTEETYGYFWGPCINAAGRMAHAYHALKLLMTRHKARAGKLAGICTKLNSWRKATQLAMVAEARAMAAKQLVRDNPPILTASSSTWHPGVVGIVAARLREFSGRPAIVGSLLPRPTEKDPDGVIWTGSGRSVKAGCDLGNLMHRAVRNKAITKGGGHPMAGGLSFSDAQRKNLAVSLGNLSGFDPASYQPTVEVALPASARTPKAWAGVFQELRPFGNGNNCPALIMEAAELIGVRVRTRKVQTAQQQVYEADAQDEAEVAVENPQPTEPARSTAKPNYWAFSQADILQLSPFVDRLRERNDEVSRYLRAQLSTPTAIALKGYPDLKPESERLCAGLVRDLNRILKEPLHDRKRFENIILRPHTRTLLRQKPARAGLIQLNRLLLEDAYPLELARMTIQAVPRVYAYEGQFVDLVTGLSFFAQWTELEEAEAMWQVHRFLKAAYDQENKPRLLHLFRLQLEVRGYVPMTERSKIYRGRGFSWGYCFQIRQCLRLRRGPITLCRMPAVKPEWGKGRLPGVDQS